MEYRKNWTAQQAVLRKLLRSKYHFEQALPHFLSQHAATHTAAISGIEWSLEDEILKGLPVELYRISPKQGVNPVAWLVWHAARIEDISLSWLVLGQPQVLDVTWSAQLGIPVRDAGTQMPFGEVLQFSQQVNIPALRAYRAAVGQATRAGVPRLNAVQLAEIVPDQAIAALVADGSIPARAGSLAAFYSQRTRSFFLTRTATSHNFLHLNEAGRLAARLLKG